MYLRKGSKIFVIKDSRWRKYYNKTLDENSEDQRFICEYGFKIKKIEMQVTVTEFKPTTT